jgi:hypothetical protein
MMASTCHYFVLRDLVDQVTWTMIIAEVGLVFNWARVLAPVANPLSCWTCIGLRDKVG